MMALTIAGRELRTMFISPLAWSILGVIQIILGFIFLVALENYLDAQGRLAGMENVPGFTYLIVVPLFENAGTIILFVMPLLTMRLISEERRNKTIALLFSAPISITEIVLGKYLGLIGFLLIAILLITLMPISLFAGGELDIGLVGSCVLALTLLLASLASLGLFLSSLATQPAVAAISTFGASLLLWIISWTPAQTGGVLEYLSLLHHYEALLKGLVSTTDLIYFVLFIVTFLVLSVHSLDNDRLQK